jgi:hypothetical protein
LTLRAVNSLTNSLSLSDSKSSIKECSLSYSPTGKAGSEAYTLAIKS